ncbi:MAG: folate-binding protein YgfZ [Actinobacteria bacterium]|nr:folate-binding protein YgfZ [Actinomycetota bacterium]
MTGLAGGPWAAERGTGCSVLVTGPDAASFLQDLVSQDLTGLGDGAGVHSLLLEPTGKMGIDFRLLLIDDGHGDDYWLDTEPGWSGALAAGFQRFLIRVHVEVADRGEAWSVASVRGAGALDVVASASGVAVPETQHGHVAWGDLRVVRADWPETEGIDLLGPKAEVGRAVASIAGAGATPAGPEEWEALRVAAGVPRQGVDLEESVIPQEALLDQVAVSFEKGCFLGQELVCRIRDRGHVNRELRRLRVAGTEVPEARAEVVSEERAVGQVTSAAGPPYLADVVCLAFVKIDVEPGDVVTVRWPTGTADALVEEVTPVA